jgi:hypothetical protein
MKLLPRCLAAQALLGCLLTLMVTSVEAKIKPKTLAPVWQNYVSIAVDANGTPHAVYQSIDYHLYHAWLDGRRWRHELVDDSSDSGWGNSIAIDAQGNLHVSYGAQRGLGAQKLVYANFSNDQWQITDLGVDGTDTVLKLDQYGQPHIAYGGANTIQHAWNDGAGWHFEDTGLSSGPYRHDFALDSNDRAHLAFSRNYDGHYYGTNEYGNWESTLLDTGNSTPIAIAIDSQNHPHVAAGVAGSVVYYRYDGAGWTSELVIDPADTEYAPVDGLALALDGNDHAHLLIAFYAGVEVSVYAFDNGLDWAAGVVDKNNSGFYPSLTLAPNGVVHGTYCTALIKDKSKAKWVNIALPDLAGVWNDASVTENGDRWNFVGTLAITNNGIKKVAKNSVVLYVSDDAELDEGDTVLPVTVKVKRLKPDATVNVPVKFQYNDSLAGKYLIAVIDPEMRTYDQNMIDNIVTIMLAP